jgi:hypothetical protein
MRKKERNTTQKKLNKQKQIIIIKKSMWLEKSNSTFPTLLVNCCCLVGDAPCLFEKTSV